MSSEVMEISDEMLAATMTNGNDTLFAHFYARYEDDVSIIVSAVLHRGCGNPSHVEDVKQEFWKRIPHSLQRYDRSRPFRPWLNAVVRNLCLSHLKEYHSGRSEQFDPLRHDSVVDTGSRILKAMWLDEAWQKLEEKDQRVIKLVLEQLDAKEMGKALGISEGAARVQRFRALKRMKGFLSQETRKK